MLDEVTTYSHEAFMQCISVHMFTSGLEPQQLRRRGVGDGLPDGAEHHHGANDQRAAGAFQDGQREGPLHPGMPCAAPLYLCMWQNCIEVFQNCQRISHTISWCVRYHRATTYRDDSRLLLPKPSQDWVACLGQMG